MATLSPTAAAAVARLRSYVPPPSTWYSLPLSRRAAVLILLYADKRGDLRVVLTMRASTLKSYSGQAALPGGKTDDLSETALRTARREAQEEIGLPSPAYPVSYGLPDAPPSTDHSDMYSPDLEEDTKYSPDTPNLPYPFKIEHLCQLPTNLAKTELGVRPCVAFLHATAPTDRHGRPVDAETGLIPQLDAREVAAVFSAPFHNFLRIEDEDPVEGAETGPPKESERAERPAGQEAQSPPNRWYLGGWTDWHETRWRMHNFYVPVRGQVVTRPKKVVEAARSAEEGAKDGDLAAGKLSKPQTSYPRLSTGTSILPYRDMPQRDAPDPLESLDRFRVWGMTARILVDCARIAYGEDPEFEHNSHFGDEAIIEALIELGRMGKKRRKGDEFRGADLRRMLSGSRL